jgi:hypothetical protein
MAEKEYIEKRKLIEAWERERADATDLRDAFDFALEDVPAADVAPVVHGEWVQNTYCNRIFYCSKCGRTVEDGSFNQNPSEHFPYCHCGAKMDGKKCVPRTEETQ